MKKIISRIVTFLLFMTMVTPVFAESLVNPVTFFESIDNLSRLDSYRLYQNFGGEVSIKPTFGDPEVINGNFNIFVETDAENTDAYQTNSYSKMRLVLNMSAEGEGQPFEELNIIARIESKTFFGQDLYFRLMGFNIHAVGVPADEMSGYEEVQSMIDSVVTPLRGKWIRIPISEFYDELGSEAELEGLGFLTNPQDLAEQLKKEGLEQTYQDVLSMILDAAVDSGELDMEDRDMADEIINEFFSTQFFTQKILKTGPYAGQHSFNINRNRVYNFLLDMARRYEEEPTLREQLELRALLDKFYVSGRYQVDEEHRLFDDFYVRLSLRDIEELEAFHLKYEQTVSHINAIGDIEEPDSSMTVEELLEDPALAPLGIFAPADWEDEDYDWEDEYDWEDDAEWENADWEADYSDVDPDLYLEYSN